MPGSYHFGEFELRPDQRQLLRGTAPVPLGGRAFDLLHCLVERRDRVVPKAELIDCVWPGTVVEENNLTVQVSALRKLLGAEALATVSGQGYRFTLPVRAPGTAATQTETQATSPRGEVPTVAVLPFAAMDADPKQQLLADSLAEDLIALLARVPGLFVIARSSSFQFRGNAVPLPDAANQLGVRYVVEGSVRGTETVKVTARLVEGDTGRVLWNGHFEAERDRAVDLQEEIARRVMMELEPELDRAEFAAIKRRRPENLDAWAHYRSGVMAVAQGGFTGESMAKSLECSRRAFEIDPEFALARAHHALFTAVAFNLGVLKRTKPLMEETIAHAEQSAAQDPGSAEVMGFAGCALCDLRHFDRGMQMLEQALELDPSNVQAHVAYGAALCVQGKTEQGLEKLRASVKLSPRDRRLGFWTWISGLFLLHAGRVEEALEEARLANRRDPRLHVGKVLEAIALMGLGRKDAAAAALAEARQLRPALTLQEIGQSHGEATAQALTEVFKQ